jgi:hypothetical protein
MDASQACQACAAAPAMAEDVLCATCATSVQLTWRVAHSRGAQRGENVRWNDGKRKPVETVRPGGDVL